MPEEIKLSWPVRVIDFEASSLEDGSFPIEVGLAVWPAQSEAVSVWSSLIQPTEHWRRFGHWSIKSRRVHGIALSELAAGATPQAVSRTLNERIGGGIVWCDGGPYDVHWLRSLFEAGGVRPCFMLGNWHGLLRALPEHSRECAMDHLEKAPPRHRAGADAEQLIQALAAGIAATSPGRTTI